MPIEIFEKSILAVSRFEEGGIAVLALLRTSCPHALGRHVRPLRRLPKRTMDRFSLRRCDGVSIVASTGEANEVRGEANGASEGRENMDTEQSAYPLADGKRR